MWDFVSWYLMVGVLIAVIDLIAAKGLTPPLRTPLTVILVWPVFLLWWVGKE